MTYFISETSPEDSCLVYSGGVTKIWLCHKVVDFHVLTHHYWLEYREVASGWRKNAAREYAFEEYSLSVFLSFLYLPPSLPLFFPNVMEVSRFSPALFPSMFSLSLGSGSFVDGTHLKE